MENKFIEIQQHEDRVAVITLNRPEKRNALNLELMDELCNALETLHTSDCRVVVIAAHGTAFCSGLDLHEAANPALMESTGASMARLLSTINNTTLVTIAAVHGDALAGGAGLVAACDLVVMDREAHIGFPEVRRGLVAALVSTILVQQMGTRHMRELLLTGEVVDAARAQSIGLVNKIVNHGDVLIEALGLAHKVLLGGPESIVMTKRLISDLITGVHPGDIQHALALHHAVRHSQEAKEGIAAFIDKRTPDWIAAS